MGITLLHCGYILFVSFTVMSPLLCQTETDQAVPNHISFLLLSTAFLFSSKSPETNHHKPQAPL